MPRSDRKHALLRLKSAPYRSRTTDDATELMLKNPSESALIQNLSASQTAPVALEAFSAMRSESEEIFQAVQGAIGRDPCKSWALLESLHRLPWYGGIRAFLSLPDPPQSSPCAYAFYILARNKIFIPPYVSGDPYNRCFRAMWRLIDLAKAGRWQDADQDVITVIEMLETHVNCSEPDEFVLYFTALVLGQMAPATTAVQNLRRHDGSDSHPAIKRVAAQAQSHLEATQPFKPPCPETYRSQNLHRQRESCGILARLVTFPTTMALGLANPVLTLLRHTQTARQRVWERS